MKRENFYRRDPGLALAGMASMSLEERGVYNTVIDLLYLTWRPLEDDRGYIAGHCRCAVQKLNPIINRLIEMEKLVRFEERGRWFISNPKFEDERADVKGPSATRSGRGKSLQVEEKSAGVREKSAGVETNLPLLKAENTENQSVTALDKSRVDHNVEANASTSDEQAMKAKPRKKPEVAIQDGFPDAEALDDARNRASAEGAEINAIREAEKFRNHAAQTDRRARDWRGAWRNWILQAIERAPKRAAGSAGPLLDVAPFPSPGVRQIVVTAKGESWARTWLDSQCRWDPDSKTIICPRQLTVDRLREAAPELEERGAKIVIGVDLDAGRSAA